MTRLIALIILIILSVTTTAQTPFKGADYIYYYQVGIGKTNGSLTTSSAWLEIGKDSTNKAMRMPRVVDTANISSPIYGLQVYQIKDNGMYFRDKVSWKRMIDPGVLNFYLLKADSTIYYPYWSNPRGYISAELDPVANAKTIRWIAGTGINVSNGAAQALSTNPVATISAQNTTAIWNANQIQNIPVSATTPTSGQFLQYNGSQYVPVNSPAAGTVTSVGLTLPSIFSVTGSPVTTAGTLTGSFVNQGANLVFASPNGISGLPSFRSFQNSDLPNSGVTAQVYGSSGQIPVITVNSKGIITAASTIATTALWDSIKNKPNSGNYIFNQSAVSQPAFFWISGSGRVDGNFLRVGSSANVANYTSLETSTVGGVIVANNSSTGIRRPLFFDALKFTFQDVPDNYAPFIIDNDQVAIDSQVTRTTIGYTAASNPAIFDSVKLFVKGDIVATARAYTSGGITAIGRNNTTGRWETFPGGGSTPTLHQVTTAGNTTTNSISVGGLTVNGNSTFNGSIRPNVTVLSDGSSLDATMVTVIGNTLSGNCTLTLPTGAGMGEVMYFIRKSDPSNTFTIQTSGGDVFNSAAGPTSLVVTNAVTVQLFGQVWYVLAQH